MKPWLVVFGNSLDFPRPGDANSPESPEEIWPHLLLQSGIIRGYWLQSRGGATCSDILHSIRSNRHYLGEEVIVALNFGIVDACPRPYPRSLSPAFELIEAWLSAFGVTWRSNRSRVLIGVWGRPWISVSKYRRTVARIQQSLPNHRLIFLGTQEPGAGLTKITGLFSMKDYNASLQQLACEHENVAYLPPNFDLHPDGQHLSKMDHERIAEEIGKKLG